MKNMSSLLPDFGDGEAPREFIRGDFEPLFVTKNEPENWHALLPETKSEINLPDLSGFPSANLSAPELPNQNIDVPETPLSAINALDGAFSISEALDASLAEATPELSQAPEVIADPTIMLSEHESQIADLTLQFEDQILELKQAHTEQVLARLAECQIRIVEELNSNLEAAVGKVLTPLANTMLGEKAVAGLVEEIGKLVDQDAVKKMQLCGPADLLAHAKSLLTDDVPSLTFMETDTVDLTLSLHNGVISTRLESWCEKLEGNDDG